MPSRPNEIKGESAAWYASFWRFCAAYLGERFAAEWCLSPEQSLSLDAGNWTVPKQLVVRSPGARNRVTALPHGTSLLDLRAALPAAGDRVENEGLRMFSAESALIACSPSYFSRNSTDVRAVLAMILDASGLLARLLEGGHTVIAGRLAGAFRNIRRDRIADDMVKTMSAAGYDVRGTRPLCRFAVFGLRGTRNISLCEQDTVAVAEDAGAGYRPLPESAGARAEHQGIHEARG